MTRAEISRNRQTAIETQASYYDGSKCKKCGSRERYVASANCRSCHNTGRHAQLKARAYQNNKDAYKDKFLKRKYGIGLLEFYVLSELQNHSCLICRETPTDRALDVDHCHTTGEVRGLLCSACNTGLGLFKDNPDSLITALEYLGYAQHLKRREEGFT